MVACNGSTTDSEDVLRSSPHAHVLQGSRRLLELRIEHQAAPETIHEVDHTLLPTNPL
jgi:hypothetical protein